MILAVLITLVKLSTLLTTSCDKDEVMTTSSTEAESTSDEIDNPPEELTTIALNIDLEPECSESETGPESTEVATTAEQSREVKETSVETHPIELPESDESSSPETQDSTNIENYINLSDDEINTLATLVYLEGGSESYDCQKAIASVVINRMTTGNMTLSEVIYQKNAFTPSSLIPYYSPSDSTLAAVKEVVHNGPSIPEYVTFFREGYFFDWAIAYIQYDHTCFSYTQAVYDKVMGN